MISKIEKIKNIGNYEDYNASGDVTFKRVTIIYAENGAGKTTLARIFHSLSTGEAVIIQKHHRINAAGFPEVVIKDNNNHQYRFNGASWNRTENKIAVFDSHFVANNIYTGFDINSDHHKHLYQFVVGDSVIPIVKKIERAKIFIDEVNNEISQIAALIVAETKIQDVDKVCRIAKQSDIDVQISNKERELTLARSREQILKLAVPRQMVINSLPIDFENAQKILTTTVDGIGQEYLSIVQQQIDKLAKNGMNRSSEWLHLGIVAQSLSNESICPFCGQPTKDMKIIDGYNQYFSKRYTEAVTSASGLAKGLASVNIDNILLQLDNQYKQIEESVKIWNTYISGTPPLAKFNSDDYQLREKFLSLLSVVEKKAANPIEAVSIESLKDFVRQYQTIQEWVKKVNTYVEEYNKKIAELKSQINPIETLQKELANLKIVKLRYDEPLESYCNRYQLLCNRSVWLKQINKNLQSRLKSASNALFAQYGTKINDYLQNVFMTKFKIEDVKDGGFRGKSKEPNLDYTLKFDDTPITQGDDGAYNTSFKNVLSEGDKNTIAFSFFLAKLTSNPDISDKIVVFDDPLTSLDLNRRNATIDQLMLLQNRCEQVIILSHNIHFLVDVDSRHELKRQEKKILQIVNAFGKSRIQEFELKKEWIDTYKKSIIVMQDFITNPDPSMQEKAINSIRLSLETFLKLKYCIYIPDPTQTFGTIIGNLQNSACTFVNPNKNEVIQKLESLREMSWRTHHASVEEREMYSEKSVNMTEALNYVNMTLHLLDKEL